jgi:hypothetical protein
MIASRNRVVPGLPTRTFAGEFRRQRDRTERLSTRGAAKDVELNPAQTNAGLELAHTTGSECSIKVLGQTPFGTPVEILE